MTPSEALLIAATTSWQAVATTNFRPFSGVNSINLYIGEYKEYLIVMDGNRIRFIDENDNSETFYLK